MINLLPPEQKRQIRAGQSNTLLLRYCIASLILATILFIPVAGAYFIINNSKKSAELAIQESDSVSASYQKVQQEANEFSSNLSTAKAILDKDVKYSKIALEIAKEIPAGIVLGSLSLDSKSFGQPIALNASGKTYDHALALKSALEESSIFKDVHLQSVTRGEEGEYPITININVTINPEATKL